MKRVLLVLMLIGFGVCARAAWAADAGEGERQRNATGDVIAAIKTTDSTAFRLKGDGTSLYAVDPYAPAWAPATYFNAINDTFTVGSTVNVLSNPAGLAFCFDSTVAMPFGAAGYTKMMLQIRAIASDSAGTDSGGVIRVGVQIRKHMNSASDTTGMAIWPQWGVYAGAGGASPGQDSLSNAVSYGQWASGLLTGERPVVVDPHAGNVGVARLRAHGVSPAFMSIDVQGDHGEVFWAPYVSVRLHCLVFAPWANPYTRKPRLILNVAMGY